MSISLRDLVSSSSNGLMGDTNFDAEAFSLCQSMAAVSASFQLGAERIRAYSSEIDLLTVRLMELGDASLRSPFSAFADTYEEIQNSNEALNQFHNSYNRIYNRASNSGIKIPIDLDYRGGQGSSSVTINSRSLFDEYDSDGSSNPTRQGLDLVGDIALRITSLFPTLTGKVISAGVGIVAKAFSLEESQQHYTSGDADRDVSRGLYESQLRYISDIELQGKNYGFQDILFENNLGISLGDQSRTSALLQDMQQYSRTTGYLRDDLYSLLEHLIYQDANRSNEEIMQLMHVLTDYGVDRPMDDVIFVSYLIDDIQKSGEINEGHESLLDSYGININDYYDSTDEIVNSMTAYEFLLENMKKENDGVAQNAGENTISGIHTILDNLENEKLGAWNKGYEAAWLDKSNEILSMARDIQDDMVYAYHQMGLWQGGIDTQRTLDYLAVMQHQFNRYDLTQMSGANITKLMAFGATQSEFMFQHSPYGQELYDMQKSLLMMDWAFVNEFPLVADRHLSLVEGKETGGLSLFLEDDYVFDGIVDEYYNTRLLLQRRSGVGGNRISVGGGNGTRGGGGGRRSPNTNRNKTLNDGGSNPISSQVGGMSVDFANSVLFDNASTHYQLEGTSQTITVFNNDITNEINMENHIKDNDADFNDIAQRVLQFIAKGLEQQQPITTSNRKK